jgi:mono/diheme cytochrome c family protein
MRRWLGRLLGLALLGLLGYAAFAFFWGVPSVPERPTARDAETIAAGKYLAAAGDCTSCHTAEGGEKYAGGYPIDTPFGRLFHYVTREDSDALHAYFMSITPVNAPAKPNEMYFPLNIRPLMFGWNLLFASRQPFRANPQKDEAWNRGAYLVEGLGHCGECHTPRNLLGAMESSEALAGATIEDFEAPDIRPEGLGPRGWTRENLALYFKTGASPQGSAFSEMFLAVKNSLRLLSHEDRMAIATYLLDSSDDTPSTGEAKVAALGDAARVNRSGQSLYLSHCSLCHGPQGQGMPQTMPPLKGNSTLAEADGINLVQVMAQGVPMQGMSPTLGYGPMPAFRDRLTNSQMANVANYVRSAFAPGASDLPPLTAADVKKILQ